LFIRPFILAVLVVLSASFPATAAIFTVTSVGDGTTGATLRTAMLNANLTAGRDTITFAIPGLGPHTIGILSQLPQLADNAGMLIDGFSQQGSGPGSAPPSTLSLKIIIDGTNAGAVHGFWIVSPYNVIRGLVVQNFQQDGIRIQATPNGTHGNLIHQNIIGVDVHGTTAQGNGSNMSAPWGGVNILVNPQTLGTVYSNTVRSCLISANYSEGVSISSCPPGDCYFNRVDSNYIGTTISGMSALGNKCDGVYIGEAAHDNHVWDNLISGNDTNGVCIIGYLDAVTQWFTDRNIIGGNVIGLAADRSTPLANGWYGVSIGRYGSVWALGHARENVIISDTIASNGRCGVMIREHYLNSANADRNTITQNAIYANGWLGIDLDDDGVTMNDAGDPDQGANEQLNMPVITSAIFLAGSTTVTGTVDIGPNPTAALVEVFKASSDASGYGEGAVYLGSATPLTGGGWSCSVAGLLPGDDVTATVTDGLGNTSEFSQIPGRVVPVEWVSIQAAHNDGVVRLQWITAAECNNAFFEIERRAGASGWRCVGSVPGSGTTNTEHRYTFADPLRDLGGETLLRYRIAQVDFDGTRDHSPETVVDIGAPPLIPVFEPVWPNPSAGELFLRFTLPVQAEVRLALSDVSGREILLDPIPVAGAAGSSTLRMSVGSLPSGIYQLVCRAGDVYEVQWVRIVK
jgi:hypothetical protein